MRGKGTIAAVAATITTALALGALMGGWSALLRVYDSDLQIGLRDQPMRIVVLDPLQISADVHTPLQIAVDDVLDARVPVDQIVTLPVRERMEVHAAFEGPVRVRMDVRVQDRIEIDQEIALNTMVETEFLGARQRLPIRGRIPLRASVPIDLVVPIDQDVPLSFDGPIEVRMEQDLKVPLRAVFDTRVPIRGRLTVPVLEPFEGTVHIQQVPTRIQVESADLQVPASAMRLGYPAQ